MTRSTRAALALLVVASLASRTLSAAPSAGDRESARRAYNDGQKMLDDGKVDEAIKQFRAAHALAGSPITAIGLARALVKKGKLVEARELALESARMEVAAKDAEKYKGPKAEAEALAGDLRERIPTLRVSLVHAPRGSEIAMLFDGARVPDAAIGIARVVDPGRHLVEVRCGERVEKRMKTVVERDAAVLEIDCAEASGVDKGAGDRDKEKDRPSDGGGAGPIPVWAWIGFGFGVVGLGVGTVTGVMTLSQSSDLKTNCPGGNCLPPQHDALSSAQGLGTISTISFIVGGVGVGVGIIGLFVRGDAKPATADHARIEPVVGLGTLGLRGFF